MITFAEPSAHFAPSHASEPPHSPFRLLLVSAEPVLTMHVRHNLEIEGHLLAAVEAAEDAAIAARAFQPDLILADLSLVEGSPVPLLPQLRGAGIVAPVLLTGALPPDGGVLDGFRVGTDEFLRLPVTLLDLHARIDFMLRRVARRARAAAVMPGTPAGGSACFSVGDAEVFPNRRVVVRGGAVIALTHKEFGLLMALVSAGGAVVSRDELLRKVWGRGDGPPTRTVESHVLKLRNKIEADGRRPRHILAVPKAGYRFQQ